MGTALMLKQLLLKERILTDKERKNLSIVLYDSEQQEVKRWNVREAYPVKWIGASFNATTPAVAIESLELAHHGFEEQ